MAEVIWTERAINQLDEIAGYIALDKPDAAVRVVKHVYAKAGMLAATPMLGRPVPELPSPNYRMLWIRPCWVYYRVSGERRIILHVRRAERPFRIEDMAIE
jgi:toxin ParE1/3/4